MSGYHGETGRERGRGGESVTDSLPQTVVTEQKCQTEQQCVETQQCTTEQQCSTQEQCTTHTQVIPETTFTEEVGGAGEIMPIPLILIMFVIFSARTS